MVNTIAENVNHSPVPEDIMVELRVGILRSDCKQPMQAAQIHKLSAHMQEEHSKVLQCVCYAAYFPNHQHASQDSDQVK